MDSKKGTSSHTQMPNPNPNPAPDLEAALLELLRRLNSTVQSGRALSAKANTAIENYRDIAFLLNTSPLRDSAIGVSK